MIIKFACGCTHDVNVTGNAKTRARRAAWLAKKTCYKCEEKAFDAAADAFIAENLGELPELTGSPKQIAWAKTIRRTFIFKLAYDHYFLVYAKMSYAKQDRFAATEDAQRIEALRALANATTHARYWIDNRDDVEQLVEDYLDELFNLPKNDDNDDNDGNDDAETVETEPTVEPVDVNNADVSVLRTIRGVGRVLAARIAAFVASLGRALESLDELLAVRGIGTKTLEKIRAAATC